MKTKICCKCKLEKILEQDFYKSHSMKDGYYSKCKQCRLEEGAERERRYRENPDYVEAQRNRMRIRNATDRYKGMYKPTKEKRQKFKSLYSIKYPEKNSALKAVAYALKNGKLIRMSKENVFHHWNYNIEYRLDIIELHHRLHRKLHRYIGYDKDKMIFFVKETGELLNTREKHLAFYETIKDIVP